MYKFRSKMIFGWIETILNSAASYGTTGRGAREIAAGYCTKNNEYLFFHDYKSRPQTTATTELII